MAQKTIFNINERNEVIHRTGLLFAEMMPNFYGKVTLNIQGGKYVNANIEESIKPIISKGEINET